MTSTQLNNHPFTIVAPELGAGDYAPPGWRRLVDCPLTILVGVTGVGKSTTIEELTRLVDNLRILPDRRTLTDTMIIAELQRQDGQPVASVTDRQARFAYTRRYRTIHPGGMAHALAQLRLAPAPAGAPVLFDGLRGVDEVQAALALFPQAHFVALIAPDFVRVRRLLGRNDAFDHIALHEKLEQTDFTALGVPDADRLLTHDEQQALSALVASGQVAAADLAAKLKIVAEERRNYDPAATVQIMQEGAPARCTIIDTTRHTPSEAAAVMAPLLHAVPSSA